MSKKPFLATTYIDIES